MWELVKAGGWLMLPLILCSILTVAISIERFIRLRRSQVLPKLLMSDGVQIFLISSQIWSRILLPKTQH